MTAGLRRLWAWACVNHLGLLKLVQVALLAWIALSLQTLVDGNDLHLLRYINSSLGTIVESLDRLREVIVLK